METPLQNNTGVKIGTRSILALNLLAEISTSRKFIALSACAEKLNCSVSYLESIVKVLKEHNFVSSRTGPLGGYSLAMDPYDITVGSVITAVESAQKIETNISRVIGKLIMHPLYRMSVRDVLDEVKKDE